jgi:anti-anti-sigma factor
MAMAVNCEIKNGVGLVTVTGLLNSAIAESFRNQFGTWLQSQPGVKQVVVDLGGVSYMDSSGLGALFGAFKRIAERGGDMHLARPQPMVKTVLEITCTNRILRLFGSVEEALHAAGC